jgi:hypothetical protein
MKMGAIYKDRANRRPCELGRATQHDALLAPSVASMLRHLVSAVEGVFLQQHASVLTVDESGAAHEIVMPG